MVEKLRNTMMLGKHREERSEIPTTDERKRLGDYEIN